MSFVHSLSDNKLESEGAKHVVDAIVTNTTLKKLKYALSHPQPYCQHPLTTSASCMQTRMQPPPSMNHKQPCSTITKPDTTPAHFRTTHAPLRKAHVLMSDGWVVRGVCLRVRVLPASSSHARPVLVPQLAS